MTQSPNKSQKVPKLRFPEFSGEWESKLFGEIADIKRGAASQHLNYVNEASHGIRLLRIGDFLGNEPVYVVETEDIKKFKVKANDLLIAGTGATAGIVFKIPKGFDGLAYSYNAPRIRTKGAYFDFLYFYLLSDIVLRQQKALFVGNAQPFLDTNAIKGFEFGLPSTLEQTKIAEFLGAVDERIGALKQKRDLLAQYKRGIMQKIFTQKIRFVQPNGEPYPDWETKNFDEVFDRVTRKNQENNLNVLTISGQNGLISQLEYFNKSVSAENVTGYYLLNKGEFAYNKSYSNGYPMGAIKRLNRYEKGVVSTLYICFKAKDDNTSEFYEQYFESGYFNPEIQSIAQEGARNHGLLNLSVLEFFKVTSLPYPHPEEQQRIADFLSAIDAKIEAVAAQIDQTTAFKKGLLQQMFV